MNQPKGQNQDEFRSAVAVTVIWVAGLTLVVIFVALFAGILLDRVLNTKPILTVVFTVASIPLTLYLTYRVAKTATGRLKPDAKKDNLEEVPHRGEND